MNHRILPAVIVTRAASSLQAALIGRAPVTLGGTAYQAHFVDLRNATRLADAKLARTDSFGKVRP
jgi:hypothetical protein